VTQCVWAHTSLSIDLYVGPEPLPFSPASDPDDSDDLTDNPVWPGRVAVRERRVADLRALDPDNPAKGTFCGKVRRSACAMESSPSMLPPSSGSSEFARMGRRRRTRCAEGRLQGLRMLLWRGRRGGGGGGHVVMHSPPRKLTDCGRKDGII
jgi:hypothetical protein